MFDTEGFISYLKKNYTVDISVTHDVKLQNFINNSTIYECKDFEYLHVYVDPWFAVFMKNRLQCEPRDVAQFLEDGHRKFNYIYCNYDTYPYGRVFFMYLACQKDILYDKLSKLEKLKVFL